MSTLVYMKFLEQTPEKYDRGMRLLTLGWIDRIKVEIADRWVEPGQAVLEIGCGTGSLAARMAARGARVMAIDVSEPMLALARITAPAVELNHMTAVEIDDLGAERFDRVVATLSLSELSEAEVDHVVRAAARLLRPGGRLVVADEVEPARWWGRLLAAVVRAPLAALTFLLTQNTTHALKELDARLEAAGLRRVHRQGYLLGTLALVVAEKP